MSAEKCNSYRTFDGPLLENHQVEEESHGASSDLHRSQHLHARQLLRTTSHDSATIPPFASFITNTFSNETLVSSTMGHPFSSGIAGTGLRGLFEPFNPLMSTRERHQELFHPQSTVHTIDENKFNSGFDSPYLSSTDIAQRWTPMAVALERLQQALNMIPATEKLDYLAALQVAPDLVLKESDPTRFLRCTNFDALSAARKLVAYWKSRRSIFGDRAYRPMTMTGDGALSADEIAFIKGGSIAYAPNDQAGCTVAIFDSSRRTSDLAHVRKRGTFYHAQYISENPTSQTSGFVVLCVVNAPKYDQVIAEGISMLLNIFPLKVKSWHALDCMTDEDPLRQGYLLGSMEHLLNELNKSSVYFHSSGSKEDTVWELVTEHGLSLDAIPDCVGGKWTYQRFEEWLIERMRVEQGLFFFLPTGEPSAYDSRRMDTSPRLQKRSKLSDEGQLQEDEDSKPRASHSNNTRHGSIEELLERFQQLLFSGSGASTGTPNPQGNGEHRGHSIEWIREGPFPDLNTSIAKLEELQKALDAISVLEKVDFLTALHVVPHLVLKESQPSRFLAFHEFDAEKAAQSIVSYWKQRHDLFGDRTFLPMTMTGDGALTADDIEFFKCGNLVITGKDRDGCSVLVFDAARRTTDNAGVRMRTAFYTWQVLCENHANHTSGFVGIQIISTPNYDKVVTEAVQMVLKVFPIKAKALHTFDMMNTVDLFRRGPVLIGVIFNLYSTAKTFFHSPERNDLQTNHGLLKEVLPCNIGGTWSYERFDEWHVQRVKFEIETYSTLLSDSHAPDRRSLESQHVASTVAAGRNSDATLCEQILIASKNAVQLTSTACSFSEVQTSENSAAQDNKHLSILDSEIRRFPLDLTAAYLEATEKAPREIWNDECNAESFLRVEDFDSKKAAERLVRYWQLRKQIYGPKRHDRLTQTGDEALGRQELPVLNTGFLTLLPMDSEGHSVLCIDPGRLKDTVSKVARDRCMFYMMSLLTENDKSQTDGAILIHKVCPLASNFVDIPLFEKLTMALPLRLHAIHLVCHGGVPLDVVKSLEHLNAKVHVHTSISKDVLLSKLETFGLFKANLPKFVNGDWGYEKFVQWQELRTRMEWRIPAGLSGRECVDMSSFPGIKSYTLFVADVVERKRRMNLIHFRRKQSRDRVAIAILKDQCTDLYEEQNELRQENQDLEAKYIAASSIVQEISLH